MSAQRKAEAALQIDRAELDLCLESNSPVEAFEAILAIRQAHAASQGIDASCIVTSRITLWRALETKRHSPLIRRIIQELSADQLTWLTHRNQVVYREVLRMHSRDDFLFLLDRLPQTGLLADVGTRELFSDGKTDHHRTISIAGSSLAWAIIRARAAKFADANEAAAYALNGKGVTPTDEHRAEFLAATLEGIAAAVLTDNGAIERLKQAFDVGAKVVNVGEVGTKLKMAAVRLNSAAVMEHLGSRGMGEWDAHADEKPGKTFLAKLFLEPSYKERVYQDGHADALACCFQQGYRENGELFYSIVSGVEELVRTCATECPGAVDKLTRVARKKYPAMCHIADVAQQAVRHRNAAEVADGMRPEAGGRRRRLQL